MSRVHWVALATGARIGGKTLTRLLEHFGSLEEALNASQSDLEAVPHIGPQTARAIVGIDLARVEADMAAYASEDVRAVTWEDPDYPANLLRTGDAPPVLFVRGSLEEGDRKAVAIIGTREPEQSSADLAQQMGYELAGRGLTIVSGLALGIDTAAHQGALDASGRTLAVLGGGVLNVYPRQNASLADAIQRSGALLCEAHPRAEVSRQGLIARNRITSGLSRAVIVVQSSADSGSANTARRALDQGRALYVVAGAQADGEFVARGARLLEPGRIDWDRLAEEIAALPVA